MLKYSSNVLKSIVIIFLVCTIIVENVCAENNQYFTLVGKWELDADQYISSLTDGEGKRDGLLFQYLTVYYDFCDDGSLLVSYCGNLFIENWFPSEITAGVSSWRFDGQHLLIADEKYELIKENDDRILLLSNGRYPVMIFNRLRTLEQIIKFGHFEQDNNTQNGAEEIEWCIIEETDDYLLLLSKFALKAMPYYQGYDPIVWRNSLVYNWLNGEFLNSFNESEHQSMVGIVVDESGFSTAAFDSQDYSLAVLPTQNDVKKCVNEHIDLEIIPTAYAQSFGASDMACWLYDVYPIGFPYTLTQFGIIALDYPESVLYVRPIICLSKTSENEIILEQQTSS